jgi:hypothetical protein
VSRAPRAAFVVRFAFGDMWIDDFGGFQEWRIHIP